MIVFDKIVKKMLKNGGKIIFKDDIFEIIDPEKKEKNQNKLDKIIYRLKASGVILRLKAGVYIIPSLEDKELNKIDLLDKYYLKLIKKYISFYVGADYFISGQKALEFNLKDFSIPEKLFITNKSINKKIIIGNYEIIFKTISGKIEGKKINLFTKLKEFSINQEIENINFKISCLELALVESAIVNDNNLGVDFGLLNKTIKKYSKVMKKEIFYEIGKFKFVMSFNRLKTLSKNIDKQLYEVFLDIIKKNGGLFIGEGLRGF